MEWLFKMVPVFGGIGIAAPEYFMVRKVFPSRNGLTVPCFVTFLNARVRRHQRESRDIWSIANK
jgi:hypothetical protein